MSRFRNAIFISYSHADNKAGWVDAFHTRLENWLGVLGVSAPIWRDKKLQGADVFSDEILDELRQSALLISILSPNGMRSNWCEKERQKFEQFAELTGGFRVGNLVRAVKVVMTPADNNAHQSVFGTLGFEFFERNSQTGFYDHFFPADAKFEKLIDQLGQTIRNALQALESGLPDPGKPLVHVADVTPDLKEDRIKVVNQLEAWGCRVTPVDPPASRAAITAALSGAVLSVHLLSDKRGTIPDDEEKSIVALQYELASGAGTDRIVWVVPGKQPHQSVALALDAGSAHGLERIEGNTTLEDLKDLLAARLKSVNEPVKQATPSSRMNIYVVCDQKDHPFSEAAEDRESALTLKSFFDEQGYVVWLPPAGKTDPEQRDNDHLETLKMSDAVIVYWGNSDEQWFRGTLRALNVARSKYRSARPFAAEALYLARPPRPEKQQYHRQLELVVEQFDSFHAEALRPFLDRLQR